MNKRLKKSIYSLCAAAGFLSSVFIPCYSAVGEHFSAPELVYSSAVAEVIPSASDFSDVDSAAWYYPYVDLLVKKSIVNGTSDTTYTPDGTFTVAECAAVVTRYLGLEKHAADRRNQMVFAGIPGSEHWYSGYIQTLADAGIINAAEYGAALADGYVSAPADEIFSRPIKRYEFADLITRSFELDTTLLTAKNLYPEVCTNGNSFIIGAKYDDTVWSYAAEISDFYSIPEAYRTNVLKAYYNGIFNGDALGNFNPEANLTRSEMAKVIAVITDRSLRKRTEYRNVSELYRITEDKFITDGWGEKTLDRNTGCLLLHEASWNMASTFDGTSTSLTYTPGIFPENYGVEVRVYTYTAGKYSLCAQSLVNGGPISCTGSDMRVIFTLRNLENAKIEGALRADIFPDGNIVYTTMFKPVIS